jgi:GGDEF domain-containing protein/PAS domain-containing protein
MTLLEVFLTASRQPPSGWTAGEMALRERARLASLGAGDTLQSEAVLGSGRIVRIRWKRTVDGSWVATHEDITIERDRVQALERRETELARQNMRFEAAVDHMSQGLCMFDARQELIICNKRFANLYGLPPEMWFPARAMELCAIASPGFEPKMAQAYIRGGSAGHRSGRTRSSGRASGQAGDLGDPSAAGRQLGLDHETSPSSGGKARIVISPADALTDLPNRMQFRERMENAETVASAPGGVARDLDHFKSVNDLYGHGVGDAVLKHVAGSFVPGDRLVATSAGRVAVLRRPGSPQDAAALPGIRRTMRPLCHQEIILGASVGIASLPTTAGTPRR